MKKVCESCSAEPDVMSRIFPASGKSMLVCGACADVLKTRGWCVPPDRGVWLNPEAATHVRHIPPSLSAGECVKVWHSLSGKLILSEKEEELYEALTRRLTHEINILSVKVE